MKNGQKKIGVFESTINWLAAKMSDETGEEIDPRIFSKQPSIAIDHFGIRYDDGSPIIGYVSSKFALMEYWRTGIKTVSKKLRNCKNNKPSTTDHEFLRRAANDAARRVKKNLYPEVFSNDFYRSKPWLEIRFRILKRDKWKCVLCGSSPSDGAILEVDHIKPRSTYPHLALKEKNLQTLCRACNQGKSNTDETDFR